MQKRDVKKGLAMLCFGGGQEVATFMERLKKEQQKDLRQIKVNLKTIFLIV